MISFYYFYFRDLYDARYPTAAFRLAHQQFLVSVCLNEYKMNRNDFKLLLAHLNATKSKDIVDILKEVSYSNYEYS